MHELIRDHARSVSIELRREAPKRFLPINDKVSWLLWLFWTIQKSIIYLFLIDKSIIYLLIMHKTQFLGDSEHEW